MLGGDGSRSANAWETAAEELTSPLATPHTGGGGFAQGTDGDWRFRLKATVPADQACTDCRLRLEAVALSRFAWSREAWRLARGN